MLRRGLDCAAGAVMICAVCAALLLLAAEILSLSSPIADALAAAVLLNSLRRRLRPRARRRFGRGTPVTSADRPVSSADIGRQEGRHQGCQLGKGPRRLHPRSHQGMIAGDRTLVGGVYATHRTSRVAGTSPAMPAHCLMKPEVLTGHHPGHIGERPAKAGLFEATAGQPLETGR